MKTIKQHKLEQERANLLAYRHALMCNIRPEDDIKVDSMLRALAKDHTIPEEIIDKFKMAESL